MRKVSWLLALSLLIGGCASVPDAPTDALVEGDYPAILPYETSNTRAKHVGLISDMDIRTQMETGLMDLSKAYFDPASMAYRTHMFLDYDELDATDGSRGLLGTLRDDNPNGLNPGSDESFDTGNGIARGPVLVLDIYELDFYMQDSLQGISLGLVVPDTVDVDGKDTEITDEKLQAYLQVTANKLVSYMRERFNDVSSKIPILVAAYRLNTEDTDASYGGYCYSIYFNGPATDYQTIDEQHYLVPSEKYTAVDPTMASEFVQFRSNIKSILPDATFVTGEALFRDGKTVKLELNIVTHGKTAGEVMAAIQGIRKEMDSFSSSETDYRVTISNDNKTVGMMHRPAGSYTVQVLTMI